MSKIVKTHVRKPSPFQERREAALSQVRGIDLRSRVGSDDEALILVAVLENLHVP